jgi:Mce-associated membrane protein
MTMTSITTKRTFLGQTFPGGPLRAITLAMAVLAVVSFAAAGWFGLSWYRAAHDESLALGMVREAVLQDSQQAAFTLNSLDYRSVQDGLTLWEQSAAGSLLTELQANRNTYVGAITESKTITTAKVLDTAIATLDERSGTAQALVGIDVTSQTDQRDPSCVHRRIRLDMIRVGDAWKVATLVPVGAVYPKPGPCTASSSPK